MIPLQCEALSHRGVGQLLETIDDVRQFANEHLRILGVIATMYDGRTTHARKVLAEVEERYGLPVFDPPVPKSVRFAEAPGLGCSVLQHAPSSRAPGPIALWRRRSLRQWRRCRQWSTGKVTRRPIRWANGLCSGCLRPPMPVRESTDPDAASPTALPVGKRALYSGARPESDSVRATSDNPLVDRGSFTVECERCRQVSRIGLLDLLIYQFPIGGWLPRGKFDRRMTCPSCRRRSWCSVSLRHD